jgi:exosortase/archaeosortase family protein
MISNLPEASFQKIRKTSQLLMNHRILLIKTLIILVVAVEIYYADLSLIFGKAIEFTEGNITNYVLTLPFLITFVIYRKRRILIIASSREYRRSGSFRIDDALGITLCIIAVLIFVFGSETLYSLEFHMASFPIFLVGSTMLVFDIVTLRHSLFAIMLTAFLQPPPGFLISEIAADLSWTAAVLVEGVLKLAGMSILLDSRFGAPALLVTMNDGNQVPFFIGEPSSGVFSTIGLSLFALFVAYITRGKIWKRLTIFAIGFPIFFILNVARISMILSLWYLWGEAIAETFHVVSGSVIVAAGTLVLLVIAEKMLKLVIRNQKKPIRTRCAACDKSLSFNELLCLYCGSPLIENDHKIRYTSGRIIVLATLCILLVSSSIVSQTANATRSTKLSELDITKITGPETTDYFMPPIEGWLLKYGYRDNRIESTLNQDAALAFRYTKDNPNSANSGNLAVTPYVYASIQISTGHHIWEDSLVVYPSRVGRPSATIIESSDNSISHDKSGRFLLFKRVGATTTEAVFYWFERLPLKFGSDFQQRNVLISLWSNTDFLARTGILKSADDAEGIRELYLSMAKIIANYWTVQSSQVFSNEIISVFIREHIDILVYLTLVPALIILLRHVIKSLILKRAYGRIYDRLKDEDKSLFAGFAAGKNKHLLTGETIFEDYEKKLNRQISEKEMVQTLKYAQKSGLLKAHLESVQDEPLLVWRPSFALVRLSAPKHDN